MPRLRKYPEELLERGVRLVFESGRPIAGVARDLGVGAEVLRKRVRQAEADSGRRSDLLTTQEREEMRTAAQGELRAAPRERDLEGGERVFRQVAMPGRAPVSDEIGEPPRVRDEGRSSLAP
jgi:transposase-like protein